MTKKTYTLTTEEVVRIPVYQNIDELREYACDEEICGFIEEIYGMVISGILATALQRENCDAFEIKVTPQIMGAVARIESVTIRYEGVTEEQVRMALTQIDYNEVSNGVMYLTDAMGAEELGMGLFA